MPIAFLIAVLVCVLLAGLALLTLGLRGRPVNDHPHCRRCTFDLSGLTNAGTCPECGAPLAGPRAIRIGTRSRAPRLLILGTMFTLVSALPLIAYVVMESAITNFNPYKPWWMLRSDLAGPSPAASDAAAKELLARLQPPLSSSPAAAPAVPPVPNWLPAILDSLLDLHADRSRPWSADDDALFVKAVALGAVSPAQFARYGRNAVAVTLDTRKVLSTIGGLVFRINEKRDRYGSAGLPVSIASHLAIALDGTRLSDPALDRWNLSWPSPGGGTGSSNQPIPTTLTPGVHVIEATLDLAALTTDQHAAANADTKTFTSGPSKVSARWTQSYRISVEVCPDDHPVIGLLHDPDLEPIVRKAITIQSLSRSISGTSDYLNASILFDQLRTPLGYRILLRTGNREFFFATINQPVTSGSSSWGLGAQTPTDWPAVDRVDVIFRPDPAAAYQNPDIQEIWDGELIFKDIPITTIAR